MNFLQKYMKMDMKLAFSITGKKMVLIKEKYTYHARFILIISIDWSLIF